MSTMVLSCRAPMRSAMPAEATAPPAAATTQPLMHLPQPMLLLRSGRQLLLANPPARRLQQDGGLELAAGRLMRLGSMQASALESQLRMALAGTPTQSAVWFAPAARTASLAVQALAAPLRRHWELPDDCLLLCLQIDQPELTQRARLDALCEQARLSKTERCVLLLLADGLAPDAAADQLGVCLSTVRSHVRGLLAKTRARSLLQLLRWLGSAQSLPE